MKMQTFLLFSVALLLIRDAATQTAPTTLPENYAVISRNPTDCAPSDCTIFVAANLNEGDYTYMDIYMERTAGGYVAMGFSASPSMFQADVIACTRNSADDSIQVLDTWNPSSPSRSNQIDDTGTQDVLMFNSSFTNGRIRCSVTRRIFGSDSSRDINLVGSLYILYAYLTGDLTSPAMLQNHGGSSRAVTSDLIALPGAPGTTAAPTTLALTTMETPTTPGPTTQGPNPTTPVIEPQDSHLIFRQPSGCNLSDCEIFIGINTNAGNSDYLDIYLEGEAVGWVAVGFTETDNMFSADVVACNRNPDTGVVTAYDTWHPAAPVRANEIDPTQDIVQFSAIEEDGRIRCSVAKRIDSSDADRDLNLNASYYVIYARRNGPSSAGGLVAHTFTERFVTANQVNPVTEGGELPTGNGRGLTANCVSISFAVLVVTAIITFFH